MEEGAKLMRPNRAGCPRFLVAHDTALYPISHWPTRMVGQPANDGLD